MPASAESSPPTVAEERPLAERLVLYLNGATWSGDAAVALQAVMEAALTDGTPLLLVHEQRAEHDPVPFKVFFERTPQALLDRNIYRAIAVPLYDGDEFQRVCLRQMVGAPQDTLPSTSWQRRWPMMWRRRQVHIDDEHDDTPVLLEMQGVKRSAKV